MSSLVGITDLENLLLYLQERVREFDPTIDTDPGSEFYNTVLQPLLTRLGPDPYNTPVREFILGRLAVEFPDLVLQDGEPIDDLIVKPMQILLEAFRRQIQQVSNNQSLANPATLNELEADNLGANYFVRRKQGGTSIGIARLYYSAPQGAIVTPNNAVYDGAGHRFFPVENQAISSSNMLFNIENNLYYFDVVVRAEQEGTDYNIAENTLIGIEDAQSVIKVTNKSAFEEGDDKETTETYIERVENSLTEKSLVTFRGINARLLDVFESIRLIQVIGFGDPEMNRDIITGEAESAPYAYFKAHWASVSSITVDTLFLLTDGSTADSYDVGAEIGDVITWVQMGGSQVISTHVVTSWSPDGDTFTVTPDFSGTSVPATDWFTIQKASSGIRLSDIPGGILEPNTPYGEIRINNNEVHIGGMVDVFVRAGDPTQKSTILEGILDGAPLRFGVDLETFGERENEFVHVTPIILAQAFQTNEDRFGDALTDPTYFHILIRQYDDTGTPIVPWKPTADDVGRYIQILTINQGLLEILEVLDEEYLGTDRAVRIKVSTTNEENPGATYTPTVDPGFATDFRIVESISTKNRVRDQDGTRYVAGSGSTYAGSDLAALGAGIGDSVVLESGDDAGIFTIRRIFDWIDTGDTLLLDRDLTKTITPLGTGDGSGVRYRIADELNVDLVSPKVVKVPVGAIFDGSDLSTVAGSEVVTVTTSTNFLLAGVEADDTLEILEGGDKGTYTIKSVTGTTATLDRAVNNTLSQLTFSVYRAFTGVERPLVRVKKIELLDSNSQPTGITIPYGDNVDVRALGVFSNRAEGVQQESYTGETETGTGSLKVRLYDANVDFVAEGVLPGYRLNILNTDNAGAYVVALVGAADGLPSDNYIEVELPASGGSEWITVTTDVHYTVGQLSAGVARIYFQEPTSVEILTGLAGGRLSYDETGQERLFFFSEVDGYPVYPAAGSSSSKSREIRSVRYYETPTPGEFETIVELTDLLEGGVFGLEVQVGDVLEVNQQIPFCRFSGSDTFAELGVFGKPAGLRTVAGSNRVTVPTNSLIDFTAMNNLYPLAGQLLYIDEGPDAGEYVIESVVDAKTLRLNKVMTSSTETIVLKEIVGLRNATLSPNTNSTNLTDASDNPGTQIGNYITIFESTRGDIDGTYEIKSIPGSNVVEIDLDPSTHPHLATVVDPMGVGAFSWVNTTGSERVGYAFRIYKDVPTQAEVLQVSTKRTDLDIDGVGNVSALNKIFGTIDFDAAGVVPGDRVEILSGPNMGAYPIVALSYTAPGPTNNTLEIANNTLHRFSVTGSGHVYRVWGGLHGSVTMLTVGKFESDVGKIEPGEMMPFRLLRPKVLRLSSTDMNENFDGSFYYVDAQVESLGSGDEYNLERNSRMTIKSGLSADGYTYTVANNNLTFSPYEQVSLNFDRRFLPVGNSDSPENMTEVSGRNLKVVYESSTTAKLVHDLLRSEADRPVNANPLGRHFLPSYVFCTLQYRGGPLVNEVGQAIQDYINTLGALDELEISDLEAFLTRRGATSIEHPITLAVVTHDIDRKLVVNRTENRLGGILDVPYNGTGRISCFFAILGEGLVITKLS